MIKKIVGIGIAILLLSGMMGIGTWAYFSDFEAVTGNVMTAGTLLLKTNDANGTSQTLFAKNMEPGTTIGPEYIILKNDGSLDASSLDIQFSYIEDDDDINPVPMTANQTAAGIELMTLKYGGVSIIGTVSDSNSNGYQDIQDLLASDLSGLSGIIAEASKEFEISIKPRSDISKVFQGDGITITMTFTLNQQ